MLLYHNIHSESWRNDFASWARKQFSPPSYFKNVYKYFLRTFWRPQNICARGECPPGPPTTRFCSHYQLATASAHGISILLSYIQVNSIRYSFLIFEDFFTIIVLNKYFEIILLLQCFRGSNIAIKCIRVSVRQSSVGRIRLY